MTQRQTNGTGLVGIFLSDIRKVINYESSFISVNLLKATGLQISLYVLSRLYSSKVTEKKKNL